MSYQIGSVVMPPQTFIKHRAVRKDSAMLEKLTQYMRHSHVERQSLQDPRSRH
jgi:hypothetical protein